MAVLLTGAVMVMAMVQFPALMAATAQVLVMEFRRSDSFKPYNLLLYQRNCFSSS